MREKTYWILSAIALILVPVALSLGDWYGTLLFPYPMIPSTILFFLLWPLGLGYGPDSLMIGPILFYLAAHSLLRGKTQISKTNSVILILLTGLNALSLANTFGKSYEFHGPTWTSLLLIVSVAWLCLIWRLYFYAKRVESYWAVLAYHFTFVLWIITYAFPLLGQIDI